MAFEQGWIKIQRGLACCAGIAALYVAIPAALAIEAGQFYRYVNEEGVKVISSSIPPEYAQKGYEVINRTGQVIREVEAAPDPEEVEAEKAIRAQQRALMAEYKVLARRYSSEKEIFAARDRRLSHLNANIAILKSNINNLEGQIDSLMSKAAGFERAGKKVPPIVLQNLEATREELTSTQDVLKSREAEHDEIYKTFEYSAKLYRKGKELEAKLREEGGIRSLDEALFSGSRERD